MNRRTSPIWKLPKCEFEKIVKNATSIASILRLFGFTPTGANHRMVKKRCIEDNIDFSHIPLGMNSNKGRGFNKKAIPLELVMIENSTYSTSTLKARLIKGGILENKCAICDLDNNWNGKLLVMRLDHINGNPKDHRLENLRLVCPNCDSQLETFCGRNFKKHYFCEDCGKRITKHSKSRLCSKCIWTTYRRVDRPTLEVLLNDIESMGYVATGRKYGVSDNAIRKWIKQYPES